MLCSVLWYLWCYGMSTSKQTMFEVFTLGTQGVMEEIFKNIQYCSFAQGKVAIL